MGNLCSNTNYNQIDSPEIEVDVFDIFDINVAKSNTQNIDNFSKQAYEEKFNQILKELIVRINKSIEIHSNNLEHSCTIYILKNGILCNFNVDKKYKKDSYDTFYKNKLIDTIVKIYKDKNYYAEGSHINSRIYIKW